MNIYTYDYQLCAAVPARASMAACMDHEEPTQADGALETENLEAPCPGGREEEMSEVCWSLWPLLCAPHCYVRPHLPRGADEGICPEGQMKAAAVSTAVLPRSGQMKDSRLYCPARSFSLSLRSTFGKAGLTESTRKKSYYAGAVVRSYWT